MQIVDCSSEDREYITSLLATEPHFPLPSDLFLPLSLLPTVASNTVMVSSRPLWSSHNSGGGWPTRCTQRSAFKQALGIFLPVLAMTDLVSLRLI